MAFTPLWGTGFEQGATTIFNAADIFGCLMTAVPAQVKTGDYGLSVATAGWWARVSVAGTPSDLYVSLWVLPIAGFTCSVDVILTDGNYCRLQYNAPNWDAYVNAALVDSGVVNTNFAYQSVIARFLINNAGSITTYIDGIADISYAGDTQPGAVTAIQYVRVNALCYLDDWCFGTGGWPIGGYRFDGLLPDGDSAVQWSRSAGVDNYALVDEVPPSDADYVYTTTDNFMDKYTIDDWDETDKAPQFVVLWERAEKDDALGHQLELVADDGVESIGAPQNLLTSWSYINRLMTTAPSGAAWSNALIDALLIGQRAQLV